MTEPQSVKPQRFVVWERWSHEPTAEAWLAVSRPISKRDAMEFSGLCDGYVTIRPLGEDPNA